MCFSANASFGSAAVLIALGSFTTIANHSKTQRMLSAIPLFFGLQQASEGLVWQTMEKNTALPLHQFGIMSFLGFALVVWPSWLSWSIFQIEPNKKRKKILRLLDL